MFKNPRIHKTKVAIKLTNADNPIIMAKNPHPKTEPTTNMIKKSISPKEIIPLIMCFRPTSVLDLKGNPIGGN
jgi:hypothetical protein